MHSRSATPFHELQADVRAALFAHDAKRHVVWRIAGERVAAFEHEVEAETILATPDRAEHLERTRTWSEQPHRLAGGFLEAAELAEPERRRRHPPEALREVVATFVPALLCAASHRRPPALSQASASGSGEPPADLKPPADLQSARPPRAARR